LKKVKILIADEIDLRKISVLKKSFFEISKKFGISNSEILRSYNNYEILIIRSVRIIDRNFLRKCNFKIIATCSRGTDNIDVEYANRKKIAIINADEANATSTAEHTFALILAIYKNLFTSGRLVRESKFNIYNFHRYELKGKKIGIIGVGRVGSRVAVFAKAFNMQIIANDIDSFVVKSHPELEFKSLNYLLKNSDIVTIHIPLNKTNSNFLNRDKLINLKKNAVLINTARGEVIDEKYLFKLLLNKKIYYAGLDVFKNEPEINKDFFKLENVILTNHIAGKTKESFKRIPAEIFYKIIDIFSHKTGNE
jgi:D-3-phosphoglycerate dehydrogenase